MADTGSIARTMITFGSGKGPRRTDWEKVLNPDSDDPATVEYDKNPKVNWSALQSLFLDECQSHVLFLLDCCFAASVVQYTDGSSMVEAIVAAGFNRVAPLQGKDSFTRFLTEVLKECRNDHKAVYTNRLCSLVSSRMNQTDSRIERGTSRRVTPHHLFFSNSPSKIKLYPMNKDTIIKVEVSASTVLIPQSNSVVPTIAEPPDSRSIDQATNIGARRAWTSSEQPAANQSDYLTMAKHREVSPARSGSSELSDLVSNHSAITLTDTRLQRSFSSSPTLVGDVNSPYGRLSSDEIRIAHLQPCESFEDPLSCYFTIHRLSSVPIPSYKAISWIWGPRQEGQKGFNMQIIENNRSFSIKILPNLEQALRHIRSRSDEISIWADGICINQESLRERYELIPQIPTFIRNASEIVAWLGTGDGDSEMAMDFIPRLVDLTEFDALVKGERAPVQWQALVKLMENTYFSRRWVFLEVILARRAVLHCGHRQVP